MRLGSSPRGRGKPIVVEVAEHSDGLIPARAGKTTPAGGPGAASRAHPRAGGENLRLGRSGVKLGGSSPRGRGKRQIGLAHQLLQRLIPARAGKTAHTETSSSTPRPHPRAGGENGSLSSCRLDGEGSSPRGRGKPCPSPLTSRERRLIPARAGKTQLEGCRH